MQCYQLAVKHAKVRLDLNHGTWLMPLCMVINMESTVNYNNPLKQTMPGMWLGSNNDVDKSTKELGMQHMAGHPSK